MMNGKPRPPKQEPATTAPPPAKAATRSLDVLVVEDNPVNQKLAAALLTKWEHRAVVASDGAQGLEALARQHFDLVLMDVQMPVMDGVAATCAIRAGERQRGGHIPIIAITAHAGIKDRARCLDAGVDRYLTKPMSSDLLRYAIAELFPTVASEPGILSVAAVGGQVDFEQMTAFVGDDPVLLAEVVQIFLDDTPVILARAVRAIAEGDLHALEASAHRLKGSLSTLGAATTAETAGLLESMGRDGVLNGAAELCARLSREIDIASESLRMWKCQTAA